MTVRLHRPEVELPTQSIRQPSRERWSTEACYIALVGNYRLVRLLGEGGMGQVWEALDLLGRPVALKWLRHELVRDPDARERFRREARAMADVTHPHVVPLLTFEMADSILFLTMPLLIGENLDSRLRRDGMLPLADLLRIGRQIAQGLAAIHEKGLCHRDLKPSNVYLEQLERPLGSGKGRPDLEDFVRLLDFGLACRRDDASLTQTGFVAGTACYMAPERLQGIRGEASSDLFSLGVVLYAMATGRTSFDKPTWLLGRPSARRPGLPRDFDDLVLQLLAADPADRPSSARLVAAVLGSLEPVAALAQAS